MRCHCVCICSCIVRRDRFPFISFVGSDVLLLSLIRVVSLSCFHLETIRPWKTTKR